LRGSEGAGLTVLGKRPTKSRFWLQEVVAYSATTCLLCIALCARTQGLCVGRSTVLSFDLLTGNCGRHSGPALLCSPPPPLSLLGYGRLRTVELCQRCSTTRCPAEQRPDNSPFPVLKDSAKRAIVRPFLRAANQALERNDASTLKASKQSSTKHSGLYKHFMLYSQYPLGYCVGVRSA